MPHRLFPQPGGGPHAIGVEREQRDTGGMDTPERHLRRGEGHQRHRQQKQQQPRLKDIRQISCRMFEVGPTVNHIR